MDVTRYRARLAELLAEYRVPGAALGILHHGSVTDVAVGVADITTHVPVTAGTIFQCGSMTKTWTALAFMQLVDEGRANLDEPIRTYLPDFRVADPDVSARLTPRRLLNHTNGIEEDYGDPGEAEDVLARMVEHIAGARQFSPLGGPHGYSAALGYAILARVMEVIDGTGWDTLMHDRLFAPMGSSGATTWREQVDGSRAATGHLLRSTREGPITTPVDFLPRAFGPGGNISATVGDVLALAHVFLRGGVAPNGERIVSGAAIREMTMSRVPVPDPYMFGPEWALGLIVCDWHGQTVYAHDGSTIGQNARLRILPDSDLALVLLTNGGPRESLYKAVFNEILSDLGAVTIPDLPDPDRDRVLELSRYVGVYERPGSSFEVTAEGGRLHLVMTIDPVQAAFLGRPERLVHDLLPLDDTHFLIPPIGPLEDPQTLALFDFGDDGARYLHIDSRLHPRRTQVHA